jgi:nucleoside-diphosphate-sugar epimerase
MDLLVLGAGFTGRRVASRFLARGARVVITARTPPGPQVPGAIVHELSLPDRNTLSELRLLLAPGTLVLHSIPLIRVESGLWDPTPELLAAAGDFAARIVYLSTTGVYGDCRVVDENTPVNPKTPRETLRVDAERVVTGGQWSSMILRPAAIYGPWRGVHQAMRESRFRLGGGGNYISRIHVDDLAALAEAALLSSAGGAWPVADDEPCPSQEIASFCADLLKLPMPPVVPREDLSETRRSDRRVDGRAVRRLLNVQLRYPSYRFGIPAALEEEAGR